AWVDIKDMARCTLVVEEETQVSTALNLLKHHFRAGAGTGIVFTEEKIITGSESWNKAGYSGWTIFVSKQGHKAEIQVNTPMIMYAKSLPEFTKTYEN